MRKVGRFLLILPPVSAVFAQDQWNCQNPECIGHKAGYEWALNRLITAENCDAAGEHYNSPSFAESCKTAIIFKQQWASTFASYSMALAKTDGLPMNCYLAESSERKHLRKEQSIQIKTVARAVAASAAPAPL